jgi:hypothetical protein
MSMIFSTHQVITMLGLTYLPDEFTQVEYAQYVHKSPQSVSREICIKQKKGELIKVRTTRNKWGIKINVYRMN